nr:protein ABIL2-like isoform X1 [Ipomoea batatas]
MGSESPSSFPLNAPTQTSNSEEIFMHHSLHFTESLKKQLVVDSLKDYVSKAVISTVDHLGSVASKLDTFLDEKVDEFSDTKLRFSCIEQSDENISFEKASIYFQDDIHQSQHKQGHCLTSAFLGATTKALPPLPRKRHSKPSSIETSPNSLAFSFTRAASTKEGNDHILHFAFHSSVLESYANRFNFSPLLAISNGLEGGSYAAAGISPVGFSAQNLPLKTTDSESILLTVPVKLSCNTNPAAVCLPLLVSTVIVSSSMCSIELSLQVPNVELSRLELLVFKFTCSGNEDFFCASPEVDLNVLNEGSTKA